MLSMTIYEPAYISAARADVKQRVEMFAALRAGAGKSGVAAVDAFEPTFFNDQVIRLEAAFVHRMRGREGKDGNPLNEVRILAGSLLEHGGTVEVEKSIKWKADQTVLGLAAGDTIALSADDFVRLADAFFTDLEAKYS
jgi:hypothetical protein